MRWSRCFDLGEGEIRSSNYAVNTGRTYGNYGGSVFAVFLTTISSGVRRGPPRRKIWLGSRYVTFNTLAVRGGWSGSLVYTYVSRRGLKITKTRVMCSSTVWRLEIHTQDAASMRHLVLSSFFPFFFSPFLSHLFLNFLELDSRALFIRE